mgnify:CR=1 FL=1
MAPVAASVPDWIFRPTFPDLTRLVHRDDRKGQAGRPTGFIHHSCGTNAPLDALKRHTSTSSYEPPADERPGLGFAGLRARNSLKQFRPPPPFLNAILTTLATRDVFRNPAIPPAATDSTAPVLPYKERDSH